MLLSHFSASSPCHSHGSLGSSAVLDWPPTPTLPLEDTAILQLQPGSSLLLAILIMSFFVKTLNGSSLFSGQRNKSSAWLLSLSSFPYLFLSYLLSLTGSIYPASVSPSCHAPFTLSLGGAPVLTHFAQQSPIHPVALSPQSHIREALSVPTRSRPHHHSYLTTVLLWNAYL